LARKACDLSHHRDPDALDALAAAFAESGRYEAAVEFARKAAAAAELQGDTQLAGRIRRRVSLYEIKLPFRE
jgi:hypothetical protein